MSIFLILKNLLKYFIFIVSSFFFFFTDFNYFTTQNVYGMNSVNYFNVSKTVKFIFRHQLVTSHHTYYIARQYDIMVI